MQLDHAICDRARLARDARFDGRFFIGVTSTGIYCRPICPAPSPKRRNIRYFPSAAAAAEAGFRPCLRCRPETAPGTPAWNGTSATVSRALRLIGEGALDERSVGDVAESLGVSARHLDRLFVQHLGAPPIAVAQTRRLHFAKQLISDSDLPMTQVALASGFQSIRRFNDTFRKLYGRTPSELRRAQAQAPAAGAAEGQYVFRLAYRPPYDWESLTDFLAARATPGVEEVVDGAYRRTVAVRGKQGIVEVRHIPRHHALEVRIRFPEPSALLQIVAGVRGIFDLGADPAIIAGHLQRDPLLRRMVKRHPGLRVPGAWNGFELAVRAILGQQVTVRGATTLAGRLAARFGTPLTTVDRGGLTHVFPEAEVLAQARLEGLPQTRAEAIRGLARAVVAGKVPLSGAATAEALRTRLTSLKGIGEWTAHYVAMRALNEPDSFPAGDLVLQRALGKGKKLTSLALLRRAEAWRPWRAYAAMQLWRAAAERE
jgi:AraC family transcriptional regulator of adaptative response / DNA-3-methyladenine glycosylase II